MRPEDRKLVRDRAAEVYQNGGIGKEACEFLSTWAVGTLRREPRPNTYEFLSPAAAPPATESAVFPFQSWRVDQPPRPIVVQCAGKQPLPVGPAVLDLPLQLSVFENQ